MNPSTQEPPKKVSLFKQKMAQQRAQAEVVVPPPTQSQTRLQPENLSSSENIQSDQKQASQVNSTAVTTTKSSAVVGAPSQVLAFPESVQLTKSEIEENIVTIEQQAAIAKAKSEQNSSQIVSGPHEALLTSQLGVDPKEYDQISKENDELLKTMKPEDIEDLQKQLYAVLDPSVLDTFKRKSTKSTKKEHPSAIDEFKQDAYGQSVDQFISNNQQEIKRVFQLEVRTPNDAVKQARFDKSGKFNQQATLDNYNESAGNTSSTTTQKGSTSVEEEAKNGVEGQKIEWLDLLVLNKMIDNPNRQYNSMAIESIEKIIANMTAISQRGNSGDYLFEVAGVKVFRLDMVYYFESEMSLMYTLCRCLYIAHMTLNLTTLSCLRAYFDFLMRKELDYYKQFLVKQHTQALKDKFNAFKQIIIDENMLRQMSYLLQNEQIRAIGGKQLESRLSFLKFELDRLGFVYENIPLCVGTCKLLTQSKHAIASITFETYFSEVQSALQGLIEIDQDSSELKEGNRSGKLKEVRDLLIFGEKLDFVKKLNIGLISQHFSWNENTIENTILLILSLHDESNTLVSGVNGSEPVLLKSFLSFENAFNMELLIEGLIHQEGKAVPHCFRNVIDRIVPLDVQLQFKYHYQLKEKAGASKLKNHFLELTDVMRVFINLYSELNFQMKYILLKKTRQAMSIRAILNECFSDVLRVFIVEFVEFFTIKATAKMAASEEDSTVAVSAEEEKENKKNPTKNIVNLLDEKETALSLSFINLLSEVKQAAALVSVLNVVKQVAMRRSGMQEFLSLSSWFVNVKAKTNEGRLNERLSYLKAFFAKDDAGAAVHTLRRLVEEDSKAWFCFHKELFFLRTCKLFDDSQASFAQVDEFEVDRLLAALAERVDIEKFNVLISKNSDIPSKIVTNFNFNSFGNSPFARIVFFFLQKPFDLKMKKKILMETVLSYAYIFSSSCGERIYGKLSNYLKRIKIEGDAKIRLKFECEEIERFLNQNDIDTTSRDSFFNRFLHSYINSEESQSLDN